MPRSIKPLFCGCLVLVLSIAGRAQTAEGGAMELESLAPLRWENRLVLVYGEDAAELSSVVETFKAAKVQAEIEEWHIVWFVLGPEAVKTNFSGALAPTFGATVRTRYFPPNKRDELDGAVGVVLIGKDGGAKLRGRGLDLEEIFTLIDGMPMRRAEMRRQAD